MELNKYKLKNELQEATQSLLGGVPLAEKDKSRPQFHFLSPSRCMADGWGGTYYKGWYHLFYLVNAYGNTPTENQYNDNLCHLEIGHARSKDLLHWEHLPIVYSPNKEEGDLRSNGGATITSSVDKPVLFHTRVPEDSSIPRSHRAMTCDDDDLIVWDSVPGKEILNAENHGGPLFKNNWTDPYIFKENGRTFMILSKCITVDGEKQSIPLYEAIDSSCLKWKYLGDIFDTTGEVVNFFKLEDKWVLIYSPYSDPYYHVGTFDMETYRFTSQAEGWLSYGYSGYEHGGLRATNIFLDVPNDDIILTGAIAQFPSAVGWQYCTSIPRKLSIDSKNRVLMNPIEDFNKLCHSETNVSGILKKGEKKIICQDSAMLDVNLTISCKTEHSYIISLIDAADNSILYKLTMKENRLFNDGVNVPVDKLDKHQIRLLIDRSFAETFIDNGVASIAQCFKSKGNDINIIIESNCDNACKYNMSVRQVRNIWV